MNIYHLDVQISLTRKREAQHYVISQKGLPSATFFYLLIMEFLCLCIKRLVRQLQELRVLLV